MGISTLVDLARKSKNYEETLQEVKSEIKRMDGLLDSLLLITRIEETVKLEKENINIVQSLQSTLKQLSSEFEEKDISIKQNIPDKLEIEVHKQ
jgi:signal transduction histidine kinase